MYARSEAYKATTLGCTLRQAVLMVDGHLNADMAPWSMLLMLVCMCQSSF